MNAIISSTLTLLAMLLFSTSDLMAQMATWTDMTGQYTIQAEFVRLDGDKVRLRKSDGGEITIPLVRLNPASRMQVLRLENASRLRPQLPTRPGVGPDGGAMAGGRPRVMVPPPIAEPAPGGEAPPQPSQPATWMPFAGRCNRGCPTDASGKSLSVFVNRYGKFCGTKQVDTWQTYPGSPIP